MNRWFAALGLTLMAAACGDPVAPAAPTPVAPTITESFTGTLTVLGSNMHPFTVSQIGGLKVTLTSLTPSATVQLAVGTVSGAACAPAEAVSAQAAEAPQLSGTATITGTFCVSVTDTGTLTEPAVYAITVVHS